MSECWSGNNAYCLEMSALEAAEPSTSALKTKDYILRAQRNYIRKRLQNDPEYLKRKSEKTWKWVQKKCKEDPEYLEKRRQWQQSTQQRIKERKHINPVDPNDIFGIINKLSYYNDNTIENKTFMCEQVIKYLNEPVRIIMKDEDTTTYEGIVPRIKALKMVLKSLHNPAAVIAATLNILDMQSHGSIFEPSITHVPTEFAVITGTKRHLIVKLQSILLSFEMTT